MQISAEACAARKVGFQLSLMSLRSTDVLPTWKVTTRGAHALVKTLQLLSVRSETVSLMKKSAANLSIESGCKMFHLIHISSFCWF